MNPLQSAAALLLLALSAQAQQFKVTPLAPQAVPASLPRTGRVVQAVRYTDGTGTYTVLATETGPVGKPGAETRRADLYAAQYPAAGGAANWQVHDFAADCPLDLHARFVPGGLTVTDLDHDGTAEVWLVYRTVCRGDVSPSAQKIIMYEGTTKHAVRGTARIAVGGSAPEGGSYTLDATWLDVPAALRQHADKLWQQHRNEGVGD